MRQILGRSLLTVAAASSILAATGGYASADTGAVSGTSNSPGLLSGDSVSAPVDVPVNVCGNSVDAVALANPASGNDCGNISHSTGRDSGQQAGSGSYSTGYGSGSPGVLSGNSAEIPVHVPVNACGNTVDVLALLNPTFGNSCDASAAVLAPPVSTPPAPAPPHARPPRAHDLPPAPEAPAPEVSVPAQRTSPQLAETGFSGRAIGAAGVTSAALLLGGAMLYRRGVRPAYAGRTHL
ncbi:chaplin [Streptomyces sp. NBC_01476]|uniref:chaplin n=1 Tax=Streptomyces sp. NBC_01476 TaxID=2903881 RepID=UPI002E36DAC3|nr:chaplin [Streptomyces sp. NBC_01476]